MVNTGDFWSASRISECFFFCILELINYQEKCMFFESFSITAMFVKYNWVQYTFSGSLKQTKCVQKMKIVVAKNIVI